MDVFSSKAGARTKFIDTNLPLLKTAYATPETRIRKIVSGTITAYFYQISNKGKYNTSTASIEYSDLVETIKAIGVLKQEVDKDIAISPDYLENKFVSEDGFQIGYYVSKEKCTWYIKLEKYGSDNTLFLNDVNIIEQAFTDAKAKIDELK